VPQDEIHEVDEDDASFGGTTDKSYRWAMAYDTDASFASEVEESEAEQADADRQRGEG